MLTLVKPEELLIANIRPIHLKLLNTYDTGCVCLLITYCIYLCWILNSHRHSLHELHVITGTVLVFTQGIVQNSNNSASSTSCTALVWFVAFTILTPLPPSKPPTASPPQCTV